MNLVVGDMAKVGTFCFDTENYQFVISNNRLCPGLCLPVHGKHILFVGTMSVFLAWLLEEMCADFYSSVVVKAMGLDESPHLVSCGSGCGMQG